jgi:hypothetical protein
MKELKFDNDLCNDAKTSYDEKLNFNEIITTLSKKRVTNYNDWFYIGVALINLQFTINIITRGEVFYLFDLFSAKADNYGYSPLLPGPPAGRAWSSACPLLLDPRIILDHASSGQAVADESMAWISEHGVL